MIGRTTIEPIAVVGMSFRLPGGTHDVQGLWKLIESGERAWINIPTERYDEEVITYATQKKKKKSKLTIRHRPPITLASE